MSEEKLHLERETYKKELPRLMADAGKFVVIQGTTIMGIFGTYEDALNAAYKEFVDKPFLVKQIQATETIHYFTRDLALCL